MIRPDDEHEYGLVMPFIVCQSNGGPYQDQSFVAGCWFGRLEAEVSMIGTGCMKSWYVPSSLVPQLDLLAMHENLQFKADPWNEAPDEWTRVTFSR